MLSHQIDSIQEEGKRTKEAAEQYRKEKEAASSDNQKSKGSMKSKGYGTGNGKYDVPTAAQQAAAKTTIALPSSMTSEIQAMTGNVTNLTRNMANFLKKPFNINVQIAGSNEFKRSLRATATLEGRGTQ